LIYCVRIHIRYPFGNLLEKSKKFNDVNLEGHSESSRGLICLEKSYKFNPMKKVASLLGGRNNPSVVTVQLNLENAFEDAFHSFLLPSWHLELNLHEPFETFLKSGFHPFGE